MKSLWIAAVTLAALTTSPAWHTVPTSSASGQSVQDSQAATLSGSDVVAEFTKTINVKHVKAGDPVKARVTQDVLSHGKVVIRRGSNLLGHVTEVKVRSKEDPESRLGIVFDKALLKHGEEINFSATVRALAPGMRLGAVDQPDQMAPVLVPNNQGPQPLSGSSTPSTVRGGSSAPSTRSMASINAAANGGVYQPPVINGPNPESGLISGGTRGVFGLPGLHLNALPGGEGSVVSSTRQNVKLDSGTQVVIQVSSQHP